ncbi:transposase [Solihabitans fulvus]|uniref:transposase n=1 Tax=Solihabitans fulvus TaxID=1892852 RepID=UPI003F680CC2
MPIGTGEIAWLPALLDPLPLAETVVAADALHTTRDHAHHLTGAHCVFTGKANQHRLHTRLKYLPWPDNTGPDNTDTGHGRTEHRVLTTLPAYQAGPAWIADCLRGHWRIENRPHWVRDVTYGEDASRARTPGDGVTAHPRDLRATAGRAHQHRPRATTHGPRHQPTTTLARYHGLTSTNDSVGTPTHPGGLPLASLFRATGAGQRQVAGCG